MKYVSITKYIHEGMICTRNHESETAIAVMVKPRAVRHKKLLNKVWVYTCTQQASPAGRPDKIKTLAYDGSSLVKHKQISIKLIFHYYHIQCSNHEDETRAMIL